ncbi:MAG: cytochrome P450 [Acidimicrobiales bacterium]
MSDAPSPGCPHFDHHHQYVDDDTDRYGTYAALQQERVARSEAYGGFWILTRHDDVAAAEADWETFSSAGGVVAPVEDQRRFNQVALEQDPPEHTAFRRLYLDLLSRARVASALPFITEVTRRRVDGLAVGGGGDFVASVAVPVPVEVVAHLLGLDDVAIAELRHLSEDAWSALSRPRRPVTATSTATPAPPATAAAPAAPESAAPQTLSRLLRLEARRRREHPRDDFLTQLLDAHIDGAPITEMGLASFLVGAVIAGHDTTLAAASNLAYQLAIDPAVQDRLRAHPELHGRAIEESLRHRSPVQNFFRTVRRPVTIGGVTMAPGERVMLLYGAANRDPDRYVHPDRFDLDRYDNDRDARGHLAYGYGVHRCAGAHLAEVELRALLETLLRYQLRLNGEVRFKPTAHGAFLAIEALPLTMTSLQ